MSKLYLVGIHAMGGIREEVLEADNFLAQDTNNAVFFYEEDNSEPIAYFTNIAFVKEIRNDEKNNS